MRFDGKSVIITGAAQGIGRACARLFAREGAKVVIADLAEEAANAVVEEIRQSGGTADAFIVDLSTGDGARDLMARTKELHGRIDISVHNVGGASCVKPFWTFTDAEIEREITRSLWPAIWCCRAALPYMIDQKAGAIVNIGSIATRGIYRVPYSAAKGGVHALTTCIALETADKGIRVNCVAPGGTEVTDRTVPRSTAEIGENDREAINAVIEQTLRDTPLGRFGTVEEQAAAVAFLASEDAAYITGQTLFVAGGGVG